MILFARLLCRDIALTRRPGYLGAQQTSGHDRAVGENGRGSRPEDEEDGTRGQAAAREEGEAPLLPSRSVVARSVCMHIWWRSVVQYYNLPYCTGYAAIMQGPYA